MGVIANGRCTDRLTFLIEKDDYNDSELNSHIQKVIDTASVLITEAEDEIKKLANETENINS